MIHEQNRSKQRVNSSQMSRTVSRSSIRSSSSTRSIVAENQRIYKNINKAKSNYSKIRTDTIHKPPNNEAKGELMRLLVGQLGVKPSVLLPSLRNIHPRTQMNATGPKSGIREKRSSLRDWSLLQQSKKRHSMVGMSSYK